MRAHLNQPVTDDQGNLVPSLTVRLLEPDSNTPISEPVYADGTSSATLGSTFAVPNGIINFYLDQPKRVRIGVAAEDAPENFFENVDVLVISDDVIHSQVLLRSPDGTTYAVTVDDSGVLVVTEAGA